MEAQIFLSEEAGAADPAVVGSQEWPDGLEATTGQKKKKSKTNKILASSEWTLVLLQYSKKSFNKLTYFLLMYFLYLLRRKCLEGRPRLLL